MLDDLPEPKRNAYPKYTVVAEKPHAICLLGMANTRMKDYFDLDVLMAEGSLDPAELRRLIDATFARRKLSLPASVPTGLGEDFAGDSSKQRQWSGFLKKNRLGAVALSAVMARLREAFHTIGVF